VRQLADDGRLEVQDAPPPPPLLRALRRPAVPSLVAVPLPPVLDAPPEPIPAAAKAPLRVYGAGIGRGLLEQVVRARQLPVEVMGSVDFPASIGLLYTAFTQFLGFSNYGDEYKVMGLAPFGEPRYVEEVMRIVRLRPGGLFFIGTAEGRIACRTPLQVLAPGAFRKVAG
jgi:hypothetical protein